MWSENASKKIDILPSAIDLTWRSFEKKITITSRSHFYVQNDSSTGHKGQINE